MRDLKPMQAFTKLAGAVVITIGCIVLFGWAVNIDTLKSIIQSGATMKANTAICFVLAAVTLRLETRQGENNKLYNLSRFWTIITFIVASLTLSQYLFGWNLGIDELLFRDPLSPTTLHPGRMGFNTAVNFLLISTALWLEIGKKEKEEGKTANNDLNPSLLTPDPSLLTLIASFISFQTLTGYIYGVKVF